MATLDEVKNGFEVYAHGAVYMSVCASSVLTKDEIVQRANRLFPTGIDSHWQISDNPTFRSGEANGADCPDYPDKRHYLLSC